MLYECVSFADVVELTVKYAREYHVECERARSEVQRFRQIKHHAQCQRTTTHANHPVEINFIYILSLLSSVLMLEAERARVK